MFNSTKNIDMLWVWFRIHWNRPIDPIQTQALLERLASDHTGEEVVFETRTYNGEVVFLVATRNCYAAELQDLFESIVPGTTLSVLVATEVRSLRPDLKVAETVQMGHPQMALNTDRISQITRSILTAMANIRQTEGLVLQVMLGGRTVPYTVPRQIQDPRESKWAAFAVGSSTPIAPEIHAGLQRRHSMHGFCTEVRIGAVAETTVRGGWLLEQVRSGLAMMEAHGARVQLLRKDQVAQLPSD